MMALYVHSSVKGIQKRGIFQCSKTVKWTISFKIERHMSPSSNTDKFVPLPYFNVFMHLFWDLRVNGIIKPCQTVC